MRHEEKKGISHWNYSFDNSNNYSRGPLVLEYVQEENHPVGTGKSDHGKKRRTL